MKMLLIVVAALLGTSPVAAKEVTCPIAKAEAHAVTAMGPYLAIGYLNPVMRVVGLPNCETVNAEVRHFPDYTMSLVAAEDDGTYTVYLSKTGD